MAARPMTYPQLTDRQWVNPVMRGYRIMCCDCQLVHTLDFKVAKDGVRFRATRHPRATAAARREQQRGKT
jgi:hypothetical protein